MRVLATTLLILGLALLAIPATAQTSGETAFTLTAKNQGGDYVWTNDAGVTNPPLTVPAGAQVTITAKQGPEGDVPHNIKVGDGPVSDTFEAAGDAVTYPFTAPASGSVPYICTIHPTTMKGNVQVAGSATTQGGDNESPGVGALGALLALAGAALLVLRRRG
jgi:PGF-CTERM protein